MSHDVDIAWSMKPGQIDNNVFVMEIIGGFEKSRCGRKAGGQKVLDYSGVAVSGR